MSLAAVLLTLVFGGVVGTVSGLFGIGGGVLNVPFLYELLDGASWTGVPVEADHQTVLAHGTSLAVIVPTALSGAWIHHRAGRVEWRVAIPMALGAMVSAPFGAGLAVGVNPDVLKTLFGTVLLAAGIRLGIRPRVDLDGESGANPRTGPAGSARVLAAAALGVFEGLFAALMGIGGAVITIPMLIWGLRVEMSRVAGTAIVVVVAAASAGVLSYVRAGAGVAGLPPFSAGYVFLPAVAALVPGAVVMARVGARLNHRTEIRRLSTLFALLLSLVGLRLILLHGLPAVTG
jgi:uncharacterized membrane protein YfcA